MKNFTFLNAIVFPKYFALLFFLGVMFGGNVWGQYTVNFDGVGETKTGYASGNVSLSGIQWNMTEALIGTEPAELISGSRTARGRGYGASVMTMNADKANGIGTITFKYRRYGTDAQTPWVVEYSTNGGTSWILAGSSFTPDGTLLDFSATVNVTGNARIRIRTETSSGTSNRRANFDDISLTDFVVANPSISSSGSLSALTTTYGTASSNTTFSVSGANMTAGILVTPPAGFEVSQSSSSGFGASTTVGGAGTIASTTVYVRLAATTVPGSYSGNVVLSSAGASSANVATVSSTVNTKNLTISGLEGANKVYDGNTAASTTGTASLVGIVGGDEVLLSGTPSFSYTTASVGNGKSMTAVGYTLSGTHAARYTLSQPTGLTADITPKSLTITGDDVIKTAGVALTGGPGSSAFTSEGLVLDETIGTVTITYGSAGDATGDGATPGLYPNQVTPSEGTGGTFSTSNYSITYVSGSITVEEAPSSPTINIFGELTALSTSYGTPSSAVFFTVSGATLNEGITIFPPSGFEVATTADFSSTIGTTSSPLVIGSAGTIANTTIYVRLSGTAVVSGSPYSGNITLSSSGADTQTIATVSSTVSEKELTISGLSATNKVYDGTTTVTVTGTPTYVGLENGESFSVSGSPSWVFATKTVGTAKTINQTGTYSAPSSNYTVTQPVLTADITAKELTIEGIAIDDKPFDNTTAASISGTANLVGVVLDDVVTLEGTTTATFASANVGDNIAVTISGYSISGTDAANYNLQQPQGLTGNIVKANQTITFGALPDKTTADLPFGLTAAASSGLAVSYTSSNSAVATVTGSMVTIIGVGQTIITASQAGNSNYNPASSVEQTLTVTIPACVTNSNQTGGWNFTTSSPSTTITNLTIGNLSQGNNNGSTTLISSTAASTGYTDASGDNNAGAAARTGALNTGAEGSAYFEFTLTPASGYNFTLTGVSFGSRSTGTGPQAYSLRSSLDNYTADVTTGSLSNNSTWTILSNTGLSTAGQGNSNPVTFRLYGYNGSGSAFPGSANWRIDDLTLTVTVSNAPSASSVGSTQNLCGTLTSASLGGNTPAVGTGTWSQTSGLGTTTFSDVNIGNSTATASVAGTYVYKWSISNGCATVNEATITVNYNSNPSAPTAGTVTHPTCSDATGTFQINTYDADRTYTFTPSNGVTISESGLVTAPEGSYTFTVDNAAGCTSASSSNIVVNAQPTVPAAPTTIITQPTCSVSTGTISITPQSEVEYSIDGSNYQESNVFSGLSPNTYTIYVRSTATGNCVASMGSQIVNAQPATPSAPTAGSLTHPTCSIATGTFQINSYDATRTYTFTPSVVSISETGLVTASEGSYTFTVDNVAGCTSPASTSIVVNAPPPTPSAPEANNTQQLCYGATVDHLVATGSSIKWYTTATDGEALLFSTALSTGTYYASQTVNGCESTRTSVSVTLVKSFTGLGQDSNWSNPSNWCGAVVPASDQAIVITSGTPILDYEYTVGTLGSLTLSGSSGLIISPAGRLTIAGDVNFNGRPVTLESDNSGTASIGQVTGTLSNATNVIAERFIPARRAWRLLTSPLKGEDNTSIYENWQNNGVVAPGKGLLLWGPQGGGDSGLGTGPQTNIWRHAGTTWVPIVNSSNTDLFEPDSNNAYLVYVTGPYGSDNITSGATATTFDATGSLITGDVIHTLNGNQFRLIPNPYASPLNTEALVSSNTGSKVWMLDPTIGLGAYVTYDGQNWSTPTPVGNDKYIQSGQAFFARTTIGSTFTIRETHKVAGNSNNWFERNANNITNSESTDRIRVLLYKQVANNWHYVDGALAVNSSDGNNEVDDIDAVKISNFNESLMFRNDTSNLSIEYRALPEEGDVQSLRLTATTASPYQLRLYVEHYSNSALQPFLEDTQTGTLTAIPTDGSEVIVPFTGVVSNASTPDNRFRIVYQATLNIDQPTASNFSVYPNPVDNGQFHIDFKTLPSTASYTISNLLGQQVQKGTLTDTQNTVFLTQLEKGIYLLQVTQDDKVITKKLYIQ